jgi:hypothetical protein
MRRSIRIPLLLSALLVLACGPGGRVAGSQAPQPVYPGAGDIDADRTPDVRDLCPREYGPPDQGGCEPIDTSNLRSLFD